MQDVQVARHDHDQGQPPLLHECVLLFLPPSSFEFRTSRDERATRASQAEAVERATRADPASHPLSPPLCAACSSCGSTRSVAGIKTGFQATTRGAFSTLLRTRALVDSSPPRKAPGADLSSSFLLPRPLAYALSHVVNCTSSYTSPSSPYLAHVAAPAQLLVALPVRERARWQVSSTRLVDPSLSPFASSSSLYLPLSTSFLPRTSTLSGRTPWPRRPSPVAHLPPPPVLSPPSQKHTSATRAVCWICSCERARREPSSSFERADSGEQARVVRLRPPRPASARAGRRTSRVAD